MLGERTDTGQLMWRQHVRRENGHRISLYGGSMLGERTDTGQLVWR